ncbi:MAG: DUF1542 domain-containing protein [Candidatus Saccharimonadaceae bacterium]
MNKKFFLLSITFFIVSLGFSQSTDFNHQIGVSLKASTNGFGGDIYYRPTEKLALKVGAEYLSIHLKDETLKKYVGDDINITIPSPMGSDLEFSNYGKIKTGALSLALGYQPFKAFYFTAGIGKYLFASDVMGTPLNDLAFTSQNIPGIGTINPRIAKEDLGVFNITVKPSNTIIPYIGIGLGSYVPRNKTISFALELGAYYVGSYVLKANIPAGIKTENIDYESSLTLEQKDLISANINSEINTAIADINAEVNKAINEINKSIEPYKFYPVLKFTIGFRAFEFK